MIVSIAASALSVTIIANPFAWYMVALCFNISPIILNLFYLVKIKTFQSGSSFLLDCVEKNNDFVQLYIIHKKHIFFKTPAVGNMSICLFTCKYICIRHSTTVADFS